MTIQGPVGSPYPGNAIELASLGFFAAVYFRTARASSRRRQGIIRQDHKADIILNVAATVYVAVILWQMWNHR